VQQVIQHITVTGRKRIFAPQHKLCINNLSDILIAGSAKLGRIKDQLEV
jgi:hypothetical protein